VYPKTIGWLPAIAFIPLLGALINACLGRRLGKAFVSVVGVAAPAVAFTISMAFFGAMQVDDRALVIRGERDVIQRVALTLVQKGLTFEEEDRPRDENGRHDIVFLRVQTSPENELVRAVASDAGVQPKDIGSASEVEGAKRAFKADLGSWIKAAGLDLRFSFILDRLSIILVLVITGVGTLIHIYSTSYMEEEDAGGFARYFTYLNLFVASMLVLVLGGDLFLLFVGWEGVGMCSYLLIGFHYRDAANAACGTKAFVVNRIGDLGFVLGAFLLLTGVRDAAGAGGTFSADVATINLLAPSMDAALVGVACLLLFIGCTGKSAQIPLHLWLPDAMAGPTPVSALIHAATMVTAGVYLIARLSPTFVIAEVQGVPVLGIVAVVGMLTAFFAATAALGQDDIKRVLAYSTVSQLGYMFVGVGATAMGAAVFHLVTHAFFKGLLFLAAGAVIHATHTQSMREMGGLRNRMPVTFVCMTIGALALAAFPGLSGFFSKDMILFQVLARAETDNAASTAWRVIYALGVVTGGITAIYSLRLICMTFLGEYRGHGQPHEAPSAMTAPLVVLAVLSVAGLLLGLPGVTPGLPHHLAELLPHFLKGIVATPLTATLPPERLHHLEIGGLVTGVVIALIGAGIGYLVWRGGPAQVPWENPTPGGLLEGTRDVLARAWLYDEVVNKKGLQPAVKSFSEVMWRWVDDATIDRGLVDGAGAVSNDLSTFARGFQTGRVGRYAGYFVIGALALPILTLWGLPIYRLLLSALAGGGADAGSGH
jgi:NADH-quinone oxidoreductase subunit L